MKYLRRKFDLLILRDAFVLLSRSISLVQFKAVVVLKQLYKSNIFVVVETVTSDPYPSVGTKREAGRRELQRARVKGRLRSLDPRFLLNDPKWSHMWYLVS